MITISTANWMRAMSPKLMPQNACHLRKIRCKRTTRPSLTKRSIRMSCNALPLLAVSSVSGPRNVSLPSIAN